MTYDEIGLLQPLDDVRIRTEIALDRLAFFIPPQGPHPPSMFHLDDLRPREPRRVGHVFAPDTGRPRVEGDVPQTVSDAGPQIHAEERIER